MFESLLMKTDITTAKFVNEYILAGVGGFVHIYHRNRHNQLLLKIKIFDGDKIHGIEEYNGKLLLYGGCCIKVLTCDWENLEFRESHSKIIEDWILASKWLSDEGIAVTVMLNKLLIFSRDFTVEKVIICEEKCILYSSLIYCNAADELIVFSGTVFNDILIWKVFLYEDRKTSSVEAKLKGHKGVIFSISYNKNSGYICSSSDDRSTIVWSINGSEITQKCKVYGHKSRVFRSLMLDELMITAGEDSYINIWTLEGKLVRRIEMHRGGPVWALDCDNELILAGGGNCGLSVTTLRFHATHDRLELPQELVVKSVAILRSNNLIAITEEGVLMYFLQVEKKWRKVDHHEDLKSYSLLQVSKCRTLFSLSGFHGEIYIYREERDAKITLLVAHQNNPRSRIFSFHWLSCIVFLTCQQAELTLWYLTENGIFSVTTFNLPNQKDLWTTTACQIGNGKYIVGDRKGNVHVFSLVSKVAVQVFKKAHNYLGATKVFRVGDKVISLGRNGIVKTFVSGDSIVEISSDKLPFSWLVDIIDGLLLVFYRENFIVWDYENKRTLLEHNCGGGHRSWDFYKQKNSVVFTYIKDNIVNSLKFDYRELWPKNIIVGYHANIINSSRIVRVNDDYVVISGSEDTSLRISLIGKDRFLSVYNLKSHLSSIRMIQVHQAFKDYLVFSGGGRGQIIFWKFSPDTFECSELSSHYEQSVNDFAEIRVMDLETVEIDGVVILLVATSEGKINVFSVTDKFQVEFKRSLFHKRKCITRISAIKMNNMHILMSASTDGNLSFWTINNILKNENILPFKITKIHQSGINSCSCKLLSEELLLLLTGGDDNCIRLNLIRSYCESATLADVCSYQNSWSHCAQITGTWLTDGYFLTTSVDQRLNIFTWRFDSSKLVCEPFTRYNSAISDIQGMECWEYSDCFDVFLYGKGIELVKCLKKTVNL